MQKKSERRIYKATMIFAGNWSGKKEDSEIQRNFWLDTKEILDQQTYYTDIGEIHIQADWSKVEEGFHRHTEMMTKLDEDESYIKLLARTMKPKEIFNSDARVEIIVTIEINNPTISTNFLEDVVNHYAHDIFIATNLAKPGICDFFNLRLESEEQQTYLHERQRLKLSGYEFEAMADVAKQNRYPKLSEIPLRNVMAWLDRFNTGIKQQAESPVQKALFSMLHVCRDDESGISSIIWITHALEALFRTTPGKGTSELKKKIIFTLEPNSREKKILMRLIEKVYSVRHSIVHGGFKTYHPQRNEIFDSKIDDQYMEMRETICTGMSIVFACIQRFIKEDAEELKVNEVMSFSKVRSD